MSGSIVRLKGVVIPADWDEQGNAIAVAISAWDEAEYRIEGDGKGELLLACIHEEVEVEGEMRENGKGKSIRVSKIRLSEERG